MFMVIFLKVPSARLGPWVSILCWTQFSTVTDSDVIGKPKKVTNIKKYIKK